MAGSEFRGLDVANSSDVRSNEDLAEWPVVEENMEIRCRATIQRLVDLCGPDDGRRRPLRVAVIGEPGVGKSSFINGIAAALSRDRWQEYAYSGPSVAGLPVTIHNRSFAKCCSGGIARYREVLLPTLLDMAGLMSEDDPNLVQLLRLLIDGRIPDDAYMLNVYTDIQLLGRGELRRRYARIYPECKVDRIIVIASTEARLPERLLQSVWTAARPDPEDDRQRRVPVFGVLTFKDRADIHGDKFRERKQSFMVNLGLLGNRLLVCTNYCDDIDPEVLRQDGCLPKLDLPILRFLLQVCSPVYGVSSDEEQVPGFGYRTTLNGDSCFALCVGVVLLMVIVVVCFLFSSGP